MTKKREKKRDRGYPKGPADRKKCYVLVKMKNKRNARFLSRLRFIKAC